jgi:hypothetical protein
MRVTFEIVFFASLLSCSFARMQRGVAAVSPWSAPRRLARDSTGSERLRVDAHLVRGLLPLAEAASVVAVERTQDASPSGLEVLLGEGAVGTRTYLNSHEGTLRLRQGANDPAPRLELTVHAADVTDASIARVLDALWTAIADLERHGVKTTVIYDFRGGKGRPSIGQVKSVLRWMSDMTPEFGDRGVVITRRIVAVAIVLPSGVVGNVVRKSVDWMVRAVRPTMPVKIFTAQRKVSIPKLEDFAKFAHAAAPASIDVSNLAPRGTLTMPA